MGLNRLDIFQKTITATNVNVTVLKKDNSNLPEIDNGFRKHLFENFDYNKTYDFLTPHFVPGTLIHYIDEFSLHYIFVDIPEEFLGCDDLRITAIGPFSDYRIEYDSIHKIMQKNKIPDRLFIDFSAFYNSVPLIQKADNLLGIVLNLASGLFEQEYTISFFSLQDNPFGSLDFQTDQLMVYPQLASSSIEERYDIESKLLNAISTGNYEQAHNYHQKFTSYYIQPRTKNLIRNQQNFTIILNTLCRKAAQEGGVPPLYIDNLSTKFAISINNTLSLKEFPALCSKMIHKYCLLVKNHAMKDYSPVIREIISYIDFCYMEDLSLNLFAEKFNMTKTYLSALFKKETGDTLTDYIHTVRMRRAITLINSSSSPVAYIASACGYNDINYFIRIFKRTYGLYPKQYQKSILSAKTQAQAKF